MLLALIFRGVAFELRSKEACACWHKLWEGAIFFGSALPAFLWGVAVTNLLRGLPISEKMIYLGSFWDLLSLYTILGGLAFFFVFAFHGAAFLSLRIRHGGLLLRIQALARPIGLLAIIAFLFCMLLTWSSTDLFKSPLAAAALVGAALVFVIGYVCMLSRRFLPSFIASSLAIALTTIAFFAGLFPRLMVSSLQPDWSLTIYNAASTPYTLTIMSIAAGCLVPIVLIYQIWTYWIFRKRISLNDLEQH